MPITGPLDADDGDVLTQWALDGLGIVLKPLFEVAHLVAEGRLVEVLPEAPPLPVTLGVLYPTRRMLPPRTKSFIDLAGRGNAPPFDQPVGAFGAAKRGLAPALSRQIAAR